MSLYIIVWIGICLFGLKDFIIKSSYKTKQNEFKILFAILSLMLIFRFGQGTDYFGYRYNYNALSSMGIDFLIYKSVHGELGYLLICNLFRWARIPFEMFVSLTAILEMGCFYRFAKRFQVDTPFALVQAYPTLYMTYFFSSIRQGIVMAVFLGVLLPLYEEKKYKEYTILTMLCMLIHGAAAVFFSVLLLTKIKSVRKIRYICVIAWLMGIFLTSPLARNMVLALGITGINVYLRSGTSITVMPILERLVLTLTVTFFYESIRKANKMTKIYYDFYRIYMLSMSIYGVFIGYSTVASRLGGVMRFVEIYLIVYGICALKISNRLLLSFFFIMLGSLMLLKNIDSYIEQGNYNDNITALSYKYVSIFNKPLIYKIRNVEEVYLIE